MQNKAPVHIGNRVNASIINENVILEKEQHSISLTPEMVFQLFKFIEHSSKKGVVYGNDNQSNR